MAVGFDADFRRRSHWPGLMSELWTRSLVFDRWITLWHLRNGVCVFKWHVCGRFVALAAMAATVTGAATNGWSVVVLSNVLFWNGSNGGDTWPDCIRVDSVSSDELLLTVLICRNVFVIVHLNPFHIRDQKCFSWFFARFCFGFVFANDWTENFTNIVWAKRVNYLKARFRLGIEFPA